MYMRILAAAAKLPKDKRSFIEISSHPCIRRVEYNPEHKHYILHPLDPSAGNHVVLSQSALKNALRRTAYSVEPPSNKVVARHEIKHGKIVVATIYTHASHGKREVDFIHLEEDHFEPLIRNIFKSTRDRITWPIRKRTTPLPVETPKIQAKPQNRKQRRIKNERNYA